MNNVTKQMYSSSIHIVYMKLFEYKYATKNFNFIFESI